MIKSLNKAYQTDSMYYWCNAEGEVNYPGSGFSTGDSERLPAAVKELYERYQFSPGYDANPCCQGRQTEGEESAPQHCNGTDQAVQAVGDRSVRRGYRPGGRRNCPVCPCGGVCESL